MKIFRTFSLLLFVGALSGCATTNHAPITIQTCEAIDENTGQARGPSRVRVVLTNESDRAVIDALVFVAYGTSGYGFPIHVHREIKEHENLAVIYNLSETENLTLIDFKWEYACFLESVTFADEDGFAKRWSGAVRSHWPSM